MGGWNSKTETKKRTYVCSIECIPPDLSIPIDRATSEEVDVVPGQEPEGRAIQVSGWVVEETAKCDEGRVKRYEEKNG